MSIVNSYKAPEPKANVEPNPQEPYDVNCCIAVPSSLESERVKLVPFIPHIHCEPFYEAFQADPNLAHWLPIPLESLASVNTFLETMVQSNPCATLFAIIDKTKPDCDTNVKESLAGIIGLFYISTSNLSAEIGPVVILTAFQRTFVTSNAIGLLMHYCLDVPSQGGLGFRRLAWSTNPLNKGSLRAAERMGFVVEGVQRWCWKLQTGKEGKEVNSEERGKGPGRDSTILSCCWDDWEGGVRDQVKKQIKRV